MLAAFSPGTCHATIRCSDSRAGGPSGISDWHRHLHLYLCQGVFLPDEQPRSLRQLSRNASPIRSLVEVEPSFGGHLQRFWHSFYFTGGNYPDTIEITKFDHHVAENACRRCHENITAEIDGNVVQGKAEGLQCTRCHNSVGHSESASAELRLLPTRSQRKPRAFTPASHFLFGAHMYG